jgi:hypothetical protein
LNRSGLLTEGLESFNGVLPLHFCLKMQYLHSL